MIKIPNRFKPLVLLLLTVVLLYLFCCAPFTGKFGIFEIKSVDMFSDIRTEQSVQ